jgi:hypothetical protein
MLSKRFVIISFVISMVAGSAVAAAGQDPRIALQRGYRTGYSDGYMAGYRDSIDNESRNIARHSDYTEARRAYSNEYGKLEDYSDGYKQGFESGYATGYDKRSFESAIPGDLAKRGNVPPPAGLIETTVAARAEPEQQPIEEIIETEPAVSSVYDETPETVETAAVPSYDTTPATTAPQTAAAQPRSPIVQNASYIQTDEPIIIIPRDTELIIEIQQPLNTETANPGDTFTAKIVSPYEIEGAMIEGRVQKVTRPGRLKRRAELLLTFDRIVLSTDRWSNFSAIVTEVIPVKGDNIKTVDNEGTAIGKGTLKDDAIKVGATTGAGLGIGALTAGPVGAAVGAGVGAAFGVGAVVVERGKEIKINQNQQMRIRTAFETKIR